VLLIPDVLLTWFDYGVRGWPVGGFFRGILRMQRACQRPL